MKISIELRESHHERHRYQPMLLRAKVPISIFDLPFFSHFETVTSNPSQLSLSLSTDFPAGPSMKLSYATAAATGPSVSVSLKSGSGLFGSPKQSPLVISANFSYNPSNPNNPNPTFSLFFKPQLGSFSLRKSTFSHPKSGSGGNADDRDAGTGSNSFRFLPLERPAEVDDFSVEKNSAENSIFKGIKLMAATQLPLARRIALNFRWSIKVTEESELTMPVLRINKIGLQRIDEVFKDENEIEYSNDADSAEQDMLKNVCLWMKSDLDALTGVNKEMRRELEELRSGYSSLTNATAVRGVAGGNFGKSPRRKAISGSDDCRSKSDSDKGENNGFMKVKKEDKKGTTTLTRDVEDEFQRAIKAAAAAASSSS